MHDVVFVDYMAVTDIFIDEQLSEGLTQEQIAFLKAHKAEMTEGLITTIMEDYYMKAAKLEVEYQLREAGLLT